MTEYISKGTYNGGKYEISHKGQLAGGRHGISRWWYENGQLWCEQSHINGELHGMDERWDENGQASYKRYYLYGNRVTKEEFRKHELIEKLSGL